MGKKRGLIGTYEVERVGCVLGQHPHTQVSQGENSEREPADSVSQSQAYQWETERKEPLPFLLPLL